MSQYYLYRHIRPDLNVPFYVGVGKKYNPNAQSFEREYLRAFSFLKGKRSDLWKRVFDKCNQHIEVEIVLESDSKEEINQKEIEFIKLHGRINNGGTLVNLTDGGEGQSGFVKSPESIERTRQANLGRKLSEEHKEKLRQVKLGKKQSPEHIENTRRANLGRKFPKEVRDKISNTLKGHSFSEETKEKISRTVKSKDHLRLRDSKGHYMKQK